MNSDHFKYSPNCYPAIELDMIGFMECLSDEFICEKVEVRDVGVKTNLKITDYKTEDCTDLEDISSNSVSGLNQKERVRKL